MKTSKALLKAAGIMPKLRLGVKKAGGGLVSTGPHRVRLIEDRTIKGVDATSGKEMEYVVYTLEENGEKKTYKTKVKNKEGQLNYLVQHLAEIPEGGEVILEMQKMGIKNYVSVLPVGGNAKVMEADEDSEEDEESDGLDDLGGN